MNLLSAEEARARALAKTDMQDPVLLQVLQEVNEAIANNDVPQYRVSVYIDMDKDISDAFDALRALGYHTRKIVSSLPSKKRYVISWHIPRKD